MHALVVKSMRDPVVFVNNNLVSVYVKFGDLVSARGCLILCWKEMLFPGRQRLTDARDMG